MIVHSFLRFKAVPPSPLQPPPRSCIDVSYSAAQNKMVARDFTGARIQFDADGGGGSDIETSFGGEGAADFEKAAAYNGAGNLTLTDILFVARSSDLNAGLCKIDFTDATVQRSWRMPDASGTIALLSSPTFTGVPAAPTAAVSTNTTQIATTAFVQAAVAALVASSPAALDTLNELAAALGNDASFSTTVTNALAAKQPLDSDLTSWAAITRAAGFDTFSTTPSSANLKTLVTDETGSSLLVFNTSPVLVTPTVTTSLTGTGALTVAAGGTAQNLTLAGSTTGVVTTASKLTVTEATNATSISAGSVVLSGGLACAQTIYTNNLTSNGSVQFGPGGAAVTLYCPAADVLQLTNPGFNGFSMLKFALTTSAAPALKRSGATLQVRLADDSAYAQIISAGTATNDSAAAGNLGEVVSSLIASGSAVSLTTATAANVTSISLTAGDWDVEGNVNFTGVGATVSGGTAGIGSTSATLPTDGSECYTGSLSTVTNTVDSITLPRKRISLSATTTVYLVGLRTFAAGTVSAFGGITARRVR